MDEDRTLHFLARVRQMENGEYVAVCEDLHAVASGETESEALQNLTKAVAKLLRAYPEEVEALAQSDLIPTAAEERVLEVVAGAAG